MAHRYIKQSGQGLRFDIFDSANNRICIAHEEGLAKKVVRALDADERKQSAINRGFGKTTLREDFSDHHGPDWTKRDGEYLK